MLLVATGASIGVDGGFVDWFLRRAVSRRRCALRDGLYGRRATARPGLMKRPTEVRRVTVSIKRLIKRLMKRLMESSGWWALQHRVERVALLVSF